MRNKVLLPLLNTWLKAQSFSKCVLNCVIFLSVILKRYHFLSADCHARDWEPYIVSNLYNSMCPSRSISALYMQENPILREARELVQRHPVTK